jgi:hypothetical protein
MRRTFFRTNQMTLTENQIEIRAERMMSALDRALLRGDLNQEDYDKAVHELDQWTEAKYRESKQLAR